MQAGRRGRRRPTTSRCNEDDDRERHGKNEDRDEGDGSDGEHRGFLQGARADAEDGLHHDGQHRGLEPEEQRLDRPDIAVERVDDQLSAMIDATPGTTKRMPAMIPPRVRCISQPM